MKMGCAPSKLLRRRRRQIGLREEVPEFPISTPPDHWVASGNYVHHDISAFISPAHQVTMLPPEDPPPYSEELQDGHITLMRGMQVFKDTADEACVNSETHGADNWDTSMVTTRDVSIVSNTSEDNTASREAAVLDAETTNEKLQHVQEVMVEDISGANSNEGNYSEAILPQMAADSALQTDIQSVTSCQNDQTTDEEVTRHSAAVSPAYVHFYSPLSHRSLSVDYSNLPNSEQLRVPNPRPPSQSMTLPAPLSTPFPPKVTLPPITRAPKNISPILTEGWAPNEQFARRPSRLPPLRKRNRVATWHGESNIVMPSASPINSMQQ